MCKDCQRKSRSNANHARRVLTTYGITSEEYAALVEHQGGVCAACGQKRGYRLNVDHDHTDERDAIEAGISPENAARWSVRGLLCRRCNKVLRDVRDSIDVLQGLAAYLEHPPAQEVLN